ncbi:hypothetical protein BN159_1453 [Streptomyces davaonensis JCM 4913]|uniref:Uncharacterized protein n=1 Tax=Streptomyces davaonensis (strain DSM 101723 / JCM 4913 / KCC S-0913 / 768) TaxID=1214101 RepID=K4QY53_STRDJ|nr:hypothetical protein [Streptomyces davaonensis]CCK25832.1 hypothetical protein BN159_1453 [Streptomyces davaonensis JCM 4913]
MSAELSVVALGHEEAAAAQPWQLEALREDLLTLDVDRVGPLESGVAPPNSRSGLVEALGALLVVLQPSLPLLEGTLAVVREWMARTESGTVVLEIDGNRLEVTGVDSAEQRRLADAWLAVVTADRS